MLYLKENLKFKLSVNNLFESKLIYTTVVKLIYTTVVKLIYTTVVKLKPLLTF